MIVSFSACGGKKGGGTPGQNENVEIPVLQPKAVTGLQVTDVEFPSGDGLMISAKLYQKDSAAPVIVMCHQAGFSDYEYAEIAPQVVELGYTCLTIDQRSGGDMNEHRNETFHRAKDKNLPVEYTDAEQDIQAGVNYGYNLRQQPIILWGSSYAAGLCLRIASKDDKIKAVIGFSPGEYFKDKNYVGSALAGFHKPVFVTCTEKESGALDKLISKIDDQYVTFYYPESKGTHGSKALWSTDPAHEQYWDAVKEFLVKMK